MKIEGYDDKNGYIQDIRALGYIAYSLMMNANKTQLD